MENIRTLKALSPIILGGTLFVLPLLGFAYDDKTTHPALTQETIKLFNAKFRDFEISSEDTEYVIQGSIDEDSDTRWMQHFYDPVYNRGLVLGREWISSKEWAQNTKAQAGILDSAFAGTLKTLFSGKDDYSWERAIYEYAWGDKKRALKALGHTLHLLQDASVPDHTRNDPHPPILDLGSPYEHWTKRFTKDTFSVVELKQKLIPINGLGEHFDQLATYSNNYFFSKDTISSGKYKFPKITKKRAEKLSDGRDYLFGYIQDINGNNIRIVQIKEPAWSEPEYSIKDIDDLILSDYWSLLSKQAILHGAGVIKLFFDEVEKEKQTKTLYNKNKSWIGKQVDKFKNAAFNLAGALYGSSIKLDDLAETTTEVSFPAGRETSKSSEIKSPRIAEVSSNAEVKAPKPLLNQGLASIIEAKPSNLSPAQNTPKSSDTSHLLPIAGVGGPPLPPVEPPIEPPPPPPVTPPDTTSPDISLTVSECNQSLSPEGCLTATTTVTVEWSSAALDLDYYEITIDGIINATTSTSTIIYVADNAAHTISAKAKDKAGNWSQAQNKTVEIATRPIIINEIAWMGTSAARNQDEWIELFNPTSKTVDLSQMKLKSLTDNKPNINLSGLLAPGGYYIIERTDDTTISDIIASTTASFGNGTGAGLVNTGETLAIKYKDMILDKTPEISACGGWCGGDSGGYFTMERYDPSAAGENASNWGTWAGFLANGKNADNSAINGTPGKRNSINYLIDKSITSLSQSKTLKKYGSPYLITSSGFSVLSGATLTIEPGVVIKLMAGGYMNINGTLKAEGTSANNIIFTSFKDDDFAGDTNADATSTVAAAGDWASIKILANGSAFDYVTIRYGGTEDLSGSYWANLRIENSSVTLKNSIIEKSKTYGVWLKNSSGTIDSNIIKNNDRNINGETPGIGLVLSATSSPTISNNQFIQNTRGALIETNSAPSLTNNSFTQNIQEAIYMINGYPTFSGNSASGNGTNGVRMEGSLTQDYVLNANLPYVISTVYTIPEGKTLTVPAGSTIKFTGSGSISVSGRLSATGTSSNKIIFTSLKDDEYGGDTDAASSTPLSGDWLNLSFNQNLATSTLDHALIRYGGDKNVFNPDDGAIRVKNSSIEIKNSIIEKNYLIGIWMQNSTSTVITDSFIQNHTDSTSEIFYGAYLTSSSTPVIKNTKFKNNETNIFTDGTSSYTDGGGNIFE